MIEKVSRKEIFDNYPLINNFISAFQVEEVNAYPEDEFLTDWLKENFHYFDLLKETVPGLNSRFFKLKIENNDLRTFTKDFSKSLQKFFLTTQTEKLIVLPALNQNVFGWLDHPYHKVKKSYKTLKEIIGADFLKEALRVNTSDFPKLFEIFFWLERCDPAIPEFIYWFDSKERFCFTLCKHGNIHVSEFTYRKTFKDDILKDCGLIKFNENCSEAFSKRGAIKGRMINIEQDKIN